MKLIDLLSGAAMALAALVVAPVASATEINFDEFPSPPVTCCYGGPITGPLVYPSVTVVDGSGGGTVMNGSGWQNEQTSGYNLFGTLSGSIYLDFTSPVSDLTMDVLNGEGGAPFTVDLYDASSTLFDSQTTVLPDWPSGWHYTYAGGGISQAVILGDGDFAVDTIIFNSGSVPEPGVWAMMLVGIGGLGAVMRARRRGDRAALAA